VEGKNKLHWMGLAVQTEAGNGKQTVQVGREGNYRTAGSRVRSGLSIACEDYRLPTR
jgi:hypothetical protein